MSRAFVKEQDDAPEILNDAPEILTERPVSANPNVVTVRGLRLIDGEIEALRRALAQAQASSDKAAIARASRDLRYWMQRRATAQLLEPPDKPSQVGFATIVTILREDGRRITLAIVGEDEADPGAGRIAYTSPMARALLGRELGEFVEIPGGEAEIVALEAIRPEG
jgi:transcription elongation GreA/GreB family factor